MNSLHIMHTPLSIRIAPHWSGSQNVFTLCHIKWKIQWNEREDIRKRTLVGQEFFFFHGFSSSMLSWYGKDSNLTGHFKTDDKINTIDDSSAENKFYWIRLRRHLNSKAPLESSQDLNYWQTLEGPRNAQRRNDSSDLLRKQIDITPYYEKHSVFLMSLLDWNCFIKQCFEEHRRSFESNFDGDASTL
jgi:hypothetical protein